MSEDDSELLKVELKRLKAVEFGDFVLASGKKSDYYVNIKRAITQPSFLKIVGRMMAPLATGARKIAGVELGAVPIAVALSMELDIPYIIVRKEKKGHGTQAAFEGTLEKGEEVVFVEDVTTTAGTMKKAILRIREAGGEIRKAISVVDRDEGAIENLRSIDVGLVPLVSIKELLNQG
ncbi:MAG: orotate phosphoribosyltransferase [Thermoplasmata archaeon]|nr:orotate phosphoribosyltransferase [Thermoplasmata archaeon]